MGVRQLLYILFISAFCRTYFISAAVTTGVTVADTAFSNYGISLHDTVLVQKKFTIPVESLLKLPVDSISSAVRRLMRDAEADTVAYLRLCEAAEECFYENSSPYYNEEVFGMFLREMTVSPVLDAFHRERARFLLQEVEKNRIGTPAADFTYVTIRGKRRTLRHTPCGDYLLLMFYESGCDHCREAVAAINADSTLCRLVDEGHLTLLAIDADSDRRTWKHASSAWFDRWTVGLETGLLRRNDLYVWSVLPSFYLLDKDKRVVLKDCSLSVVRSRLAELLR